MQIKQIVVAAAALLPGASAACLAKKQDRGWCATEATESSIESLNSVKAAEVAAKRDASLARPRALLTIPTYMHSVVNSSVSANFLSQAVLEEQLAVLNERFSPHDIQFTLAGTTRLVDNSLAPGPYGNVREAPMLAYWRDTHEGGYDTLNLWFYSNFPRGIFGACTLPQSGVPPSQYYQDGCHIASGTMLGGEITDYNLGLTAVHEVGHWLGLLHTFEGETCSGDGDLIDDTPMEAEATYGCPANKDSCPNSPGLDPIANYMDYSTDECFDNFSQGQEERMHNSYTTLREGKTA